MDRPRGLSGSTHAGAAAQLRTTVLKRYLCSFFFSAAVRTARRERRARAARCARPLETLVENSREWAMSLTVKSLRVGARDATAARDGGVVGAVCGVSRKRIRERRSCSMGRLQRFVRLLALRVTAASPTPGRGPAVCPLEEGRVGTAAGQVWGAAASPEVYGRRSLVVGRWLRGLVRRFGSLLKEGGSRNVRS